MSRHNYAFDFVVSGSRPIHLRDGGGIGHLWSVYDCLACLDESCGIAFPELAPDLLTEFRDVSNAIVILLDWDERRRQMIRQPSVAGINTRTIFVSWRGAMDIGDVDSGIQIGAEEILGGQVEEL